jgi:hypothetical protein
MSYTEYLSRKKAAAPVILDVRPKMDSSTYTRHTRVVAAANVYAPGKKVVGNINDMITRVGRDNSSVKAGVQVTMMMGNAGLGCGSGGRVPDASTFSDYAAGRAAETDYKDGPPGTTKVVLNASKDTVPAGMTFISGCCTIKEPKPQSTGVMSANTVPRNASNNTKDILSCKEYTAEPHTDPNTPMQKGIHRFVDDTISLNTGTFRIGTGNHKSTGSTIGSSNAIVGLGADGLNGGCPTAIHTYPEVARRISWGPRPSKGAGGLFNPVVPSQDHPRKIGGFVPSDRLKYVEKHHGNDFNVNPRRYPQTPFRIPAGTPAHLKINDEHRGI